MATDYFDFLNQSSQQEKPATEEPKSDGFVNLTVRADAECQVVCDGDFLFLLNANQIVKEKAPAGEHLLQFISTDNPSVCIERVVSWPEPGKNYLIIVKELAKAIESEKEPEPEGGNNPIAKMPSEEDLNRLSNYIRGVFDSYKIPIRDVFLIPGQNETLVKVDIPGETIENVRIFEADLNVSLWRAGRIEHPAATVDIKVANDNFERIKEIDEIGWDHPVLW